MKAPLLFLTKFLCISLALFVVWQPVSNAYLTTLTPAANGLCRAAGYPVRMEASDADLLNVYRFESGEFRLWASNPDVVFLNLIVLVGLFGALGLSNFRSWIARLGVGLGLLWITHVIHFVLLAYTGIFKYLRTMAQVHNVPTPELQTLAEAADRFFPYSQAVRLNLFLDFWRNWGMLAFAFLLWLVLNRRDLYHLMQRQKPNE